MDNAVGKLQEFCAQKGYAFPAYQTLSQQGESHNPIFTVKVSLGEETASGTPSLEFMKLCVNELGFPLDPCISYSYFLVFAISFSLPIHPNSKRGRGSTTTHGMSLFNFD